MSDNLITGMMSVSIHVMIDLCPFIISTSHGRGIAVFVLHIGKINVFQHGGDEHAESDLDLLKVIYHPLHSMNYFVTNKSKLPQDGAQVFPYMGWLAIMW